MATETMTTSNILAASPVAFGTSGLRGLVKDLTDVVCYAATAGFVDHGRRARGLLSGTQVLIAHDLRPSSPSMTAAVALALRDAGLVPVFCGAIPTPALAHAATIHGVPAVMVTGSHIPFDRNGIKYYYADGEMTKADEQPILSSEAPVSLTIGTRDLPPADASARNLYLDRYVKPFAGLLEGMTVGHYQHSAVGRDLTAQLLTAIGATVTVLERTEHFVPIDTEAVSQSDRDKVRGWVAAHDFDLILSTDGDGDRPLLADETGQFFQGDVLGIFAAKFLGAKTVVTPVSSNSALEACGWFETIVRTKIGSPHVIAGMAGADTVVGYEANGGMLTGSDFTLSDGSILTALPTRDALLPAIATIAFARRHGLKLSELAHLLPARFTCSDRLTEWPQKRSAALLSRLAGNTAELSSLMQPFGQVARTDETDGLRVWTDRDEIVHLRPSGNAPEFRVYVEAATPERASELLSGAMGRLASI